MLQRYDRKCRKVKGSNVINFGRRVDVLELGGSEGAESE